MIGEAAPQPFATQPFHCHPGIFCARIALVSPQEPEPGICDALLNLQGAMSHWDCWALLQAVLSRVRRPAVRLCLQLLLLRTVQCFLG